MTARIGGPLQTYTGIEFYPLDPRASEVDILDIAHSLAHMCRFGGHSDRFYSVAEHSVLVSQVVPPEHALQALLHDATEAYCVDVPRPLKRELKNYAEIEDLVWHVIAEKFGLPYAMPDVIHVADNAVLLAEKAALIANPGSAWDWAQGLQPAPVKIIGLQPMNAKAQFLQRFVQLTTHARVAA